MERNSIIHVHVATMSQILAYKADAFDLDYIGYFRRDWATSYYDTEDGICVHVNPDILKRETAAEEIAEQFPFLKSSWNCKVVDTHPGTCRALSQTADSMALGML